MPVRFLILLLLALPVFGTTFQLQTVEQQLEESDGVFIGHYLKSRTVELEDGSLATQMIFKMNQEFGLQSELFGMNEVIVHYPGGSLPEKTVRIEGTPEFVAGEKVVLFTKHVNNRYWGLNLGFGSFKVVSYGKEPMLINTLFPENTQVGQIKLEAFEKLVKEVKGSSLKVVHAPVFHNEEEEINRSPASEEPAKNRSIASKSEPLENESGRPTLSIFWLAAVLAFLGGAIRLVRQGQK